MVKDLQEMSFMNNHCSGRPNLMKFTKIILYDEMHLQIKFGQNRFSSF